MLTFIEVNTHGVTMAQAQRANDREEPQDTDATAGGVGVRAIETFEFEVNQTGDQVGLKARSENSLVNLKFWLSAEEADRVGQELVDAASD